MRNALATASILLFTLMFPMTAAAQEFSADTVSHPNGATIKGKVFRGVDKIRIEAPKSDDPDSQGWIIVDLAQQTSYIVNPSRKIILVSHGKKALRSETSTFWIAKTDNPCLSQGEPTPNGVICTKLDDETLNGRRVEKWQIALTFKGQPLNEYEWVDPALHVVVKGQVGQMTSELQNIKEGKQPPALFELPSGYQQMDFQKNPKP